MSVSRIGVLIGLLAACGGDIDPNTDPTTSNSEGPCTSGEPDAIRYDFIPSDTMEIEYKQDGVVYRVTYLIDNVAWETL